MLSVFILSVAASLQSESIGTRYDDCKALVIADIELGRRAAQQWVQEGGGWNARHCLALADLDAGYPKLAAVRLTEIAERKDAGDDYVRARLYLQASEAWLKAGETDGAEEALDAALTLVPDSGELQLLAAKVYGAQDDWQRVRNAVDKAEAEGFVSAPTYVLRGRAYYNFGAYEDAAYDVVNALNIDPTNVDALVLRGDIQLTGVTIDVSIDNAASPK